MMPQPHILLINPNTSALITEAIAALAVAEIGTRARVTVVTAPFGAHYIATRTAVTVAAHAVLEAYAQAVADSTRFDAVVVACFGDPGVDALTEIAGVPVLGFADGGLLAAAAEPGPFAIATSGVTWREMLTELALRRGLADRLAGVVLIEDRTPEIAASWITEAAKALGAARVIIGGTGLLPVLDAIAAQVAVPVIDPHRVTLEAALRAAQAQTEPQHWTPTAQFTGLSAALLDLLHRSRAARSGRDPGASDQPRSGLQAGSEA